MINRASLPPSSPLEFGPLIDLLRLVADADGASKRLLELAQTIADLKAARIAAENAQSSLAAERATHHETIQNERTAHNNKLSAASLRFDKDCREREGELATRENAVAEREREVAAAAAAAAELKADLEQRLAKLRSIAS